VSRRAVNARISGIVQGVGYRDWTMRQAQILGLDGWVRNRRDSTVEAVFSGDADAVGEMLAACRRGPEQARVDSIETSEWSEPVAPGFDFRRTE
jgi:acylphosphatase